MNNFLLGVNNMNKKLTIISILAVLMLISIALSTTVSSNAMGEERKESPLYGIRARRIINEKFETIIDNVRASFIGDDRIYFIPLSSRFLQREELQVFVTTDAFPNPLLCKLTMKLTYAGINC